MDRIGQAVILAAGEGQRLRPFTGLKPKVMIPIANKPILQYIVEALAANGVRDIIMVVGYRKEQVLNFFGSGERFGVEIRYLTQRQQLGTAHALKQARGTVADGFLVLPGDNIIEAATIAEFVRVKPNAILVKEQENVSKYGLVRVKEGVVEDVEEKPRQAEGNLINTGVYVFSQELFEFVEEEVELTSALRNMIARGHRIMAHQATGAWLDVVYPWDILKLTDVALRGISPGLAGTVESGVSIRGPVSMGKGTVIRSGSYIVGPTIIGENCDIGPCVSILPATSLGNNVVVSPFTEIKNSVIGNSVQIGSSSTLHNSIVDAGCSLRGHFMARSGLADIEINGEYHRLETGAMVGQDCQTEDGVVLQPGVLVGNHCRIGAMRVVHERIPDGSLVV